MIAGLYSDPRGRGPERGEMLIEGREGKKREDEGRKERPPCFHSAVLYPRLTTQSLSVATQPGFSIILLIMTENFIL
jgi:hypothetical protein